VPEIPLDACSPSALADPVASHCVEDGTVSWRPARGWLCSVHLRQPCEHIADLSVGKDPRWNQ
jgi:hypothetical protein